MVPKFSESPGAVAWTGPWETGSHNEEIYSGLLDLSSSEVAELKAGGVV